MLGAKVTLLSRRNFALSWGPVPPVLCLRRARCRARPRELDAPAMEALLPLLGASRSPDARRTAVRILGGQTSAGYSERGCAHRDALPPRRPRPGPPVTALGFGPFCVGLECRRWRSRDAGSSLGQQKLLPSLGGPSVGGCLPDPLPEAEAGRPTRVWSWGELRAHVWQTANASRLGTSDGSPPALVPSGTSPGTPSAGGPRRAEGALVGIQLRPGKSCSVTSTERWSETRPLE